MAEILIVEDDKSINELVQRTLRMMGHTGLPAYTGREALRAVEEKRPALMLLDLSLPDMDGFEVMEKAGDIPVICVTARDEIPDRVKGLMAGAEDYIVMLIWF